MKAREFLHIPILALALLAACTQAPKPAARQEPEKPPEPASAQSAFFQMYGAARAWAPDVQALRLDNIPVSGVKDQGGKCAAWRAIFVSQSRGQAKTWTYSVVEAEGNLHKGIFAHPEQSYSGSSGHSKPFLPIALKTDSDAAYETAVGKSAAYIKKNPDKPVNFILESTKDFPDPAWRVVWGESVSLSDYSVFVSAVTGKYLRTMR